MEGTLSDPSFLLALATILLVAVTWVTDFFQWRSIRNVDEFLKGSRDVGHQVIDALMDKEKTEDGREITNIESLATILAHKIATSISMGVKGMASGDARRMRAIENGVTQVMEGELPEDQKLLISLAKRVGEAIGMEVSPSEVGYVAEKLGLNRIGNNGHGSSGSW